MRGDELLDKMDLIDQKYVEAAESRPRRRNWIKWGAMAACFGLAVAGAFVLAGSWGEKQDLIRTEPDKTEPALYWETEPATEPNWDNGPEGVESTLGGKPMISGYGEPTYNADMAVMDGGSFYSGALKAAMEHYGDSANYRVLAELFSDGVQIASGGSQAVAEAQRLTSLGYTVAVEMYTETETDGDTVTVNATYFFTLHATYEQLKDFPVDGSLGYKFMLYDEVLGDQQGGLMQ